MQLPQFRDVIACLARKKRKYAKFDKNFCVLLSFPRSGSNFVQSVIAQSSGRYARSIYRLQLPRGSRVFNLKSHALSPVHLTDELNLFFVHPKTPEKTCILIRDPRDVMISFYEFIKKRKRINISQEAFFLSTCYYYATYNDGRNILNRRTELQPLSVKDGFKTFFNSWSISKYNCESRLIIKYEDILEEPVKKFGEIFDFYRLVCELDKSSLETKVSQYGDQSIYKRGIAGGWRANQKKYGLLIELVTEHLQEEINRLGY